VTSADFRIAVETQASAADVATVEAGLLAFNVAKIGPPNESPVRVFVRDANGRVVGGLLGHIRWRWLYVSKLWVDDSLREKGYGASLMKAAEEHAISMGCIGAYLDTFEYQARPFYEKLGYELFGTLDDYPPGYRQFHLVKRLSVQVEREK
jgi:GNAT superfamily N-acetyltransferase